MPTHGDAEVGGGQRRSVVHAVADQQHPPAASLQGPNMADLVRRQEPGVHAIVVLLPLAAMLLVLTAGALLDAEEEGWTVAGLVPGRPLVPSTSRRPRHLHRYR